MKIHFHGGGEVIGIINELINLIAHDEIYLLILMYISHSHMAAEFPLHSIEMEFDI